MYYYQYKHIYCSSACAINLGSTVLITGGKLTLTTVSQYNEAGWLGDLPELQQERRSHGCSYYDNDEGTKVGIDINYYSTIIIFKTYLVSGGLDSNNGYLSTTEILVETASAWVDTWNLPSPRYGLGGANIDNKILMTGN